MFPSPFSYVRPGRLPEALALLAQDSEGAKVLAGGQSLLPLMKLRLAAPATLIDLGDLDELRHVRIDGDTLVVGALTRFCDLETSTDVQDACPVLAHVASRVGDPQVRHRGTIGGTLAHADPASDLPMLLLALEADVVVSSVRGSRLISCLDLFEGFMTTCMTEDEILTEIRIPRHRRSWAYEKLTRRAQEWAVLGVAALSDDDGRVRVALANVGSTPLRATTVEAAWADGDDPATAAASVIADIHPFADSVGTIEYRQQLTVTLVERALSTVREGAVDA